MEGMIIISSRELETLPVWEFEKPMKEKFIALKVITGYQFDNTKLLISSGRDWFSLFVHRESGIGYGSIRHKELQKAFGAHVDLNKVYDITLWDYRGTEGLYSSDFVIEDYKKPIPPTIVHDVEATMELYSQGKITCADCGRIIDRSEIAGHFFAGVYCDPCWLGRTGKHKGKGGWQAVEACETYE